MGIWVVVVVGATVGSTVCAFVVGAAAVGAAVVGADAVVTIVVIQFDKHVPNARDSPIRTQKAKSAILSKIFPKCAIFFFKI